MKNIIKGAIKIIVLSTLLLGSLFLLYKLPWCVWHGEFYSESLQYCWDNNISTEGRMMHTIWLSGSSLCWMIIIFIAVIWGFSKND